MDIGIPIETNMTINTLNLLLLIIGCQIRNRGLVQGFIMKSLWLVFVMHTYQIGTEYKTLYLRNILHSQPLPCSNSSTPELIINYVT